MTGWLRSACGCWLAAMATLSSTGCSAGVEPEQAPADPAAKEGVSSTEGALASSCVTACMAGCVCDPADGKPTICRRQCQADCEDACTTCTPSCSGKACGAPDGCGGVCSNACPTPTVGLIDFDVTPSGIPLADASVVNTTYQSWGVTLSSISCSSSGCAPASAFARRSAGRNGTNSVSLFQTGLSIFDARYGAVEASFSQGKSTVSIDAQAVVFPESLSTPVARPFIEAYDAAGNLLTRSYYPAYGSAEFGSWQTLTVNAAGIRRVRFSSQAPGGTTPVYGSFDNLQFR